jgi:hypothetical protein
VEEDSIVIVFCIASWMMVPPPYVYITLSTPLRVGGRQVCTVYVLAAWTCGFALCAVRTKIYSYHTTITTGTTILQG